MFLEVNISELAKRALCACFWRRNGKGGLDSASNISIRTNSLNSYIILLKNKPLNGDFPGCPIVETLPSDAEGEGSVPGWGAETPPASQPNKTKTYKTGAVL